MQAKPVIQDCLGQVLNVGDVVVQANCSYTPKAQVITRLGATTKVQLNAGSYVESTWLVKINEQYKFAKGVAVLADLIELHKPNFNHVAVQDKPAPTKYMVLQVGDYDRYVQGKHTPSPKRYFVCSITGKTVGDYQSDYRDKRDYFQSIGEQTKVLGAISLRLSDNKEYSFRYFDWCYLLSKRSLTELGLDLFIDKEFSIEILEQKLGAGLRT